VAGKRKVDTVEDDNRTDAGSYNEVSDLLIDAYDRVGTYKGPTTPAVGVWTKVD
jgi:hypothetical protein